MDRRDRGEEVQAQLEQQCFNLAPERWAIIYREKMLGELGEGEIPIGADDLDELDKFMEDQEARFQQALNARHTASLNNQVEALSWGPWS
jgi:hypothetical protein